MLTFGLLAAGLLAGIVLALLALAAYQLHGSAMRLSAYTKLAVDTMASQLSDNTRQMQHLRTELMAALTRLDAAQLHEASISLQRTSRQFSRTTAMLTRLAFAQEGMAGVAADDVMREDVDPDYVHASAPPYSRPFTAADAAVSPMGAEDVLAYREHLRQRAEQEEKLRAAGVDVSSPARAPLPDIDDGWRMDRKEFEEGDLS